MNINVSPRYMPKFDSCVVPSSNLRARAHIVSVGFASALVFKCVRASVVGRTGTDLAVPQLFKEL
eukprot:3157000-Rhodomonas_salina.1